MRTFVLIVFSIILFFCDHRFHYFDTLHHKASLVVIPIQHIINTPLELARSFKSNIISKQTLLEENAKLKSQLLSIETQLQRLDFLEYENSELRVLLNYSKSVKSKLLYATLITSTTDNFVQQVTINKGKLDGVYIGQPVLDAYGLIGQVVAVGPVISTVMLITNSKSAVPVIIVRNGLQAIVVGVGTSDYLELVHVHETADVKVGDSLVTSGLGKIFPAGYQMGTIMEIKKISGERFIKVFVTPKAHINRSLYIFLLADSKQK